MPQCQACQTVYDGPACPACRTTRTQYVFQVMWNWYQEVRSRLKALVTRGEPATEHDLQAVEDLQHWAAQEGVGSVTNGFAMYAQLLEAARRERAMREREREEQEERERARHYQRIRDEDDERRRKKDSFLRDQRLRIEQEDDERDHQLRAQRIEALKKRLNKPLGQRNKLKLKAQHRNVPYFWCLTFQCFKQIALLESSPILGRILTLSNVHPQSEEESSSETPPYAKLVVTCETQICLQVSPILNVQRLWENTNLFVYLYAILRWPTKPSEQDFEVIRRLIGSGTYAQECSKKYSITLTDKAVRDRWGLDHEARQIEGRHGYPLPGAVASIHNEYYVLPWRPPKEAALKWGPLRLMMSNPLICDSFFCDLTTAGTGSSPESQKSLQLHSTLLKSELRFVYYTDTHYGNDDEYDEQLTFLGHAKPKPYYLLGQLDCLLLFGYSQNCLTPTTLGTEEHRWFSERIKEIKQRVSHLLLLICIEIEGHLDLYPHVNKRMIERMLGVPRNFLDTEFPLVMKEWDRVIGLVRTYAKWAQHELDRRAL